MRRVAAAVFLCAMMIGAGCGGDAATSAPASAPSTQAADDAEPATRPVFGLPAAWILAPQATYTAVQQAGEVTVTASGESPTAGYEVKLFQSPLRIWPPQWMLGHRKPEGMVAQVITPFEVTASFKAREPVTRVIISDAAGKHEVNVEQSKE